MKDLFSGYASQYAAFRPIYPSSLYDFILKHTARRGIAWDCACGNGQVARDLAPHFNTVMATDISQKQIDSASQAVNIHYAVMPAEKTSFADDTFDLITTAQSIHWFRTDEFFREAERVGKKGATIAYWGYALFRINREIDSIVDDFYVNIIGPYWDVERKLIDQHYQTISFPFERIPAPQFDFALNWSSHQLEGYITTWSAVQKFIASRGFNPVEELMARIRQVWRDKEHHVKFPLFLTIGKL